MQNSLLVLSYIFLYIFLVLSLYINTGKNSIFSPILTTLRAYSTLFGLLESKGVLTCENSHRCEFDTGTVGM